jgi:hypothetical protein
MEVRRNICPAEARRLRGEPSPKDVLWHRQVFLRPLVLPDIRVIVPRSYGFRSTRVMRCRSIKASFFLFVDVSEPGNALSFRMPLLRFYVPFVCGWIKTRTNRLGI